MKFHEIDKRNFSTKRATSDRQNQLASAAAEVSQRLSGSHSIKVTQVDNTTGNFAKIVSESASAPEDSNERTDYVKRAEQYLHTLTPAMGFGRDPSAEFKMDPVVQYTSSNNKVVHAQQTYQSLDIFQSGTSVRFDSNDAIKGVTGNVVTVDQNVDLTPKLAAKDAVKIAAKLVTQHPTTKQKDPFGNTMNFEPIDLEDFEPETDKVNEQDSSRTTYFKPGPFSERIKARLMFFELNPGDLRLVWEVITTQMNSLQYLTIIDATKSATKLGNDLELVLYNNVPDHVHAMSYECLYNRWSQTEGNGRLSNSFK